MASKVQKISIALPKEMVDDIRYAVDSGDYASTSEVLREAVREWRDKRRPFPPGYPYARNMDDLRRMAQEGLDSLKRGEGMPMEEVFDRLEARYQAAVKRQKAAKRHR
ncbi:MAG: type II toxin-antitoxin system ParD family antitoxin [Alphaproteobacteria bacterium]|nr:type II toxin-antitoxin system ParD family antitoxin [Alphaproteobacteria bacterium]MBL6938727.1 type II toxin-antitoxin system ParD family antitoxin [Alphaproteobacteria bacterium]MBL7097916.1 type II toxin-antitoxin system ParD family antitoxin [Alphaproteobacteria bacterium]